MKPDKTGYKDTLNLPKTTFGMRAGLTRKEPAMRQEWERTDLYGRIRQARRGSPRYILHDGPPYANGNAHIGQGLNKVLKDIVVKYETMRGFDAPYVPGWDCHGLPIEHKVLQELGEAAKTIPRTEIRRRCRQYAEKFIDIQREQFKTLGVFARWDKPYLTMTPEYEAGVIDVFARLVAAGYVYHARKPVHWCTTCKTVLAEAELEYHPQASPSIYVLFDMVGLPAEAEGVARIENPAILIWTTTPWTLPANLAAAVNPSASYAAVRLGMPEDGRTRTVFLAADLVEDVMSACGIAEYEVVCRVPGKKLTGIEYRHPFADRVSPVLEARFVALDEGSGCVHIAPGHGREDFRLGQEAGLDVFSPVDADGRFTEEAGPLAGMEIHAAEQDICENLKLSGHLLSLSKIEHSYPHCWRCRRPVIFRATPQWFVEVDHNQLRKRMLDEVEHVRWVPAWGRNRISGMIRQRPDWCISRQKAWGVPIPAFYCEKCDEPLLTEETVSAVGKVFAEKGSDSWFELAADRFLPEGAKCANCGGTSFRKETDIFDVWFESGSSSRSVLMNNADLAFPADLYLEGSDQHRGWFQLSQLSIMAGFGRTPFKTVLTHGFVVDEKGHKMSKSLGNLIDAVKPVEKFGADIMRLWLSSVDYREDIKVSMDVIGGISDAYRRIRNTFRYLLGNLADFDPAADAVPYERMCEIDRWALSAIQHLVERVTEAYENYEFYRVYHFVHNFCVVEMSSFYLDVLKDRLYTFARDSRERRSCQTVMRELLLVLTRLLAPIIVFTSEEVWKCADPDGRIAPSVHLADWPSPDPDFMDVELDARWQRFMTVRGDVTRELEKLRAEKVIGSSLEATVELYTRDEELAGFLTNFSEPLETLFIVSGVSVGTDEPGDTIAALDTPGLSIRVSVSPHPKCARCWNRRESVGTDPDYPDLCDRCREVVRQP